MRILILGCDTGKGGPPSSALALKEVFDSKGHYCVLKDVFSFLAPSRLIRRSCRRAEQKQARRPDGSVGYRCLCFGKGMLAKYVDAGDFDAVLCTHAFSVILLGEIKKLCRSAFCTALVTETGDLPVGAATDFDITFTPEGTDKKRKNGEYEISPQDICDRLIAGILSKTNP